MTKSKADLFAPPFSEPCTPYWEMPRRSSRVENEERKNSDRSTPYKKKTHPSSHTRKRNKATSDPSTPDKKTSRAASHPLGKKLRTPTELSILSAIHNFSCRVKTDLSLLPTLIHPTGSSTDSVDSPSAPAHISLAPLVADIGDDIEKEDVEEKSEEDEATIFVYGAEEGDLAVVWTNWKSLEGGVMGPAGKIVFVLARKKGEDAVGEGQGEWEVLSCADNMVQVEDES